MERGEVRSTARRRGIQTGGADEIRARSDDRLYHIFGFCQVVYDKWLIFCEITNR